jgi:hypothetical protein
MTLALVLLTNAWDSPFIVPVAGCFMIAVIVIASTAAASRKREIESQERLAAIAKGLPVPPTQAELDASRSMPVGSATRRYANIRLAGLILVSSGLGLMLMCALISAIVRVPEVLCGSAAGLIPLGIGIGMLLDARIQKRDQEATTAPPTTY